MVQQPKAATVEPPSVPSCSNGSCVGLRQLAESEQCFGLGGPRFGDAPKEVQQRSKVQLARRDKDHGSMADLDLCRKVVGEAEIQVVTRLTINNYDHLAGEELASHEAVATKQN